MQLKGTLGSINLSSQGHSTARVTVPGFGEVILSAPRAQLKEFVDLADGAEVTVTVEYAK